jgi:peroxiredoxin
MAPLMQVRQAARALGVHENGASVFGLSAQPLAEQREFAGRERLSYPLLPPPYLHRPPWPDRQGLL